MICGGEGGTRGVSKLWNTMRGMVVVEVVVMESMNKDRSSS